MILGASWVVPVAGPPLREGRVAVEDGRVVWVGGARDTAAREGPLRDLGPGVLLPGLVNAHCHLELAAFRSLSEEPRGFVPWIAALVEARAKHDGIHDLAEIDRDIRALEESGTVAVGDVSNTLAHLDRLVASSLTAVVFYELLGWDPARAQEILATAEARMAGLGADLPRRGVHVRLAAHAPHSVSPALFLGLVERGGPAALHLAESAAESRFLAAGDGEWREFLTGLGLGHVPFAAPGLSPVRYVDSLGVLRRGVVAAHCVHVDAGDREILARRGVHVAVCPRSNRHLGVGIPPVPEMLEAGVRLCLGTDSVASAGDLDLMSDVVALRREFPALDPAAILRMATLGGAEALGLADLGSIAPGKRAALTFAAASRPPEDPLEFLVSGAARLRRVAL